ncbi:MAG: hypothetical protein RIC30_04420 [Marinoscillum sp.]|uniref:hypothetical protein n=1 Tax=Marinoscillum sp. TaxID=2024838 RepID=UPI0032FE687A
MKNKIPEWLANFPMIGFAFFAIAILITITYFFMLATAGKRTKKFIFASAKETVYFDIATRFVAFGLVFFAFYAIINWIGKAAIYHIFGAGFFSIIIGVAFGYAFWAIVKYYYPFVLEKRLDKIRFKPMKSKAGNPMRLLNEEEEDEYMTPAMIEEEDNHIADYDIWVDEKTGEKVVEKYDMLFHALVCEKCNYRTMRDLKEEVVKEASTSEEGLIVKYYKCTYCGHSKSQELKVAQLS